jgi:DNA-binding GntR family transcriptional regulator
MAETSMAEHREIMSALERRALAEAEAAMSRHLERSRQRLVERLRDAHDALESH